MATGPLRHLESLAALLLALAAFAGLAAAYAAGCPLVGVDERIAAALHSRAVLPATTVAQVVTMLGGATLIAVVACVAAGFLAHRGLRQEAVLVVVAVVGAQACTGVLKTIYGAVALIVAPRRRSPAVGAACLAGAGLLVGAIGFTRLYLGVHYLSDVLAGWSIALAWLLVAATLVRAPWRLPRARRAAARAPGVGA